MTQITSGIRAVLSHPGVYSAFQALMGGHSFRTRFVRDYVCPAAGMNILDIGCGPADILAYLPEVNYWGFDVSEAYIASATRRFRTRGHFQCRALDGDDLERLPFFDVVLAIGLLHHLDDSSAQNVIGLAKRALRPGGRLVTVDPCLDPGQNAISRFLVRSDRGQKVREKPGYEALAGSVFAAPTVEVRHQTWIPYTHCIMVCEK